MIRERVWRAILTRIDPHLESDIDPHLYGYRHRSSWGSILTCMASDPHEDRSSLGVRHRSSWGSILTCVAGDPHEDRSSPVWRQTSILLTCMETDIDPHEDRSSPVWRQTSILMRIDPHLYGGRSSWGSILTCMETDIDPHEDRSSLGRSWLSVGNNTVQNFKKFEKLRHYYQSAVSSWQ